MPSRFPLWAALLVAALFRLDKGDVEANWW